MAGSLELLPHADEEVLVGLGQLREMVVSEHIRDLGLFARVILESNGTCSQPSSNAASSRPWPRVMRPLRFESVMGARQPLPSMTAAMAANWAAEWVLGFFGCGFRLATRTS